MLGLVVAVLVLLVLVLVLHCVLRMVACVLEDRARVATTPGGVVLLTRHSFRALGGVDVLLPRVSRLPPRCLLACEIVAESTVVWRCAANWLRATLVLVEATRAVGKTLLLQLVTPHRDAMLCYRTRRDDVTHGRRGGDRGLPARLSRASAA
jgi:hypothetical protein